MNILYISKIDGRPWAGPTYSVPMQICAQTKYDNVLWYNMIHSSDSEWQEVIKTWKSNDYYSDLDNYPKSSIFALPEPFCNPDLVIVEQFYNYAFSKMLFELSSGKFLYVIVPRGELCLSAQKYKHIKKFFGNLFWFNKFAKNAIAIQYLTEQEKNDSTDKWNKKYLIIPNGINFPKENKTYSSKGSINCISIGRIEPNQKGLDLLINSCAEILDDLIKAHCNIKIFGPDRVDQLQQLKQLVDRKRLSTIISFHDAIYGKEKDKKLLESDLFIMTSRFEGHPMGLIEALAYGLPCLITTGTNMREEVEAFNAGWTCDTNVESIKNALLRMIEEKYKINIYGQNARILAKEYDWDRLAHKSHTEYERIIKQCFCKNIQAVTM